jgi:hypothetical protein
MAQTKPRMGRPHSKDLRIACHIPLGRAERALCDQAAGGEELAFATWGRRILLAGARAAVAHSQSDGEVRAAACLIDVPKPQSYPQVAASKSAESQLSKRSKP